jgi:hypothetical protein
MNELTIPVITDTKINDVFIKANGYILKKYHDQFTKINNYNEKLDLLKNLWSKEFFSHLIIDKNTPISIQFFNTNSMTLFFFKFNN